MEGKIYLHEAIVERVEEQDRNGAIVIKLLKPETVLIVETKNTTYRLEIIEWESFSIQRGRRWFDLALTRLNGSTSSTCMLWPGRTGHKMHVELVLEEDIYFTTSVQATRIESPEGWHYDMEWDSTSAMCND